VLNIQVRRGLREILKIKKKEIKKTMKTKIKIIVKVKPWAAKIRALRRVTMIRKSAGT
jgi:hypothetical protein